MKRQKNHKRSLLQLMVLVLLPLVGACNLETVTVSDDQEEDRHDLPKHLVSVPREGTASLWPHETQHSQRDPHAPAPPRSLE